MAFCQLGKLVLAHGPLRFAAARVWLCVVVPSGSRPHQDWISPKVEIVGPRTNSIRHTTINLGTSICFAFGLTKKALAAASANSPYWSHWLEVARSWSGPGRWMIVKGGERRAVAASEELIA